MCLIILVHISKHKLLFLIQMHLKERQYNGFFSYILALHLQPVSYAKFKLVINYKKYKSVLN